MTTPSFNFHYEKTVLKVDHVSMGYSDQPVLRDVDFEIRDIVRDDCTQGQVVALLGPSGMGKTTLFRILAGLMKPIKGGVLIGEEQKPVEPGMVGVVFQNYQLFEHRTVLGNLTVGARRLGMPKKEAIAKSKEMLERFGLANFAKRYPVQMSGGQRQRVAIAQQFVCSQHFLLMDEPFSGLDPLAIERVSELVTEVANLHTLNTIIVVTHNIEAALQVADTVIVLGRDRNEAGELIPGARVQERYDLIAAGLAWRKGISSAPEFIEMERTIRERFRTL
ncbi:MAG TPA: ABC transporter ATP-binding protein [Thermoanaerobaculia bacterium]|nr:ABC transporter ATP-binding protein [Thermoanaerobaculia bacterium]